LRPIDLQPALEHAVAFRPADLADIPIRARGPPFFTVRRPDTPATQASSAAIAGLPPLRWATAFFILVVKTLSRSSSESVKYNNCAGRRRRHRRESWYVADSIMSACGGTG